VEPASREAVGCPVDVVAICVESAGCATELATDAPPRPAHVAGGVAGADPIGIVNALAQHYGGRVSVAGDRTAGVRCTAHLPALPPEPVRAEAAETSEPCGGRETVLVVEDEESVRNVLQTMLRRAGYEVLAAGSCDEALAAESGHAAPIDLLLADVVLPRATGTETALRIRQRRPSIGVLLISGRAQIEPSELSVADAGFLPKPFTRSQLLDAVRRTLDERRAPRPGGP
jgi:CheY-like chemotaxis protein